MSTTHQQLNRALLRSLTRTPEAADIIADRLEELEAEVSRLKDWHNRGEYAERLKAGLETENARLQLQVDSMCDAEQLRQLRAENARLRSRLLEIGSTANTAYGYSNDTRCTAHCLSIMEQARAALAQKD